MNRRASLLNTVKSEPSYYRVSDLDYESRNYEFISSYELETYWLDTWYFCTNTPLGKVKINSNQVYTFMVLFYFIGYRKMHSQLKHKEMCKKSKIAIEKSCISRDVFEVVAQDDGTIPGDNKGAAGFDSHLFA